MIARINRNCFAIAVLAFAALPIYADTGILSLAVRDVDTHFAVHAEVKIEGPKSISADTDKNGSFTLSLPAGEYRIEVSAHGYKSMTLL